MKILLVRTAPAVVICCADKAALCERCDVEIHAPNKLPNKHQRLLLDCLSNQLPRCDICQEKTAFIFCVEDRALSCRDCDEAIHVGGSLSGNHQRYLATGIRVVLSSMCINDTEKSHYEPPDQNFGMLDFMVPTTKANPSSFMHAAWAVDEFLQLYDYESGDKKESPVGFGELEWFVDIGFFPEQIPKGKSAAAEVPELPIPQINNAAFYGSSKIGTSHKRPGIEISNDEDYFIVPDIR